MMGGRTFEFRICVLLDVVLKPKMQISFFLCFCYGNSNTALAGCAPDILAVALTAYNSTVYCSAQFLEIQNIYSYVLGKYVFEIFKKNVHYILLRNAYSNPTTELPPTKSKKACCEHYIWHIRTTTLNMQRKERKSVTERIKSHTFQRFCFYYNEFLLESTQSHD